VLGDYRAPHLSNLHEDPQLSGKICHSLLDCADGKQVHIGRHDGEPTPTIVLRGVGIEKNHASISLTDGGEFLLKSAPAARETTFVNGKLVPLEG
jgi:hypothetical protein